MNKENKQENLNKEKEKIIKNTFTRNEFWTKNVDNCDTILGLDGKFFKKIELYTKNKEDKIIKLSDLTNITVSFSKYDNDSSRLSDEKKIIYSQFVGKPRYMYITLKPNFDSMLYEEKNCGCRIISNVYVKDNFFTVLLGSGEDKKYVLCFEK